MVKSSSVSARANGSATNRKTASPARPAKGASLVSRGAAGEKPTCRHDDAPARRTAVATLALARAAAIFRACGDPERLRMLERLSHGEHCVSELAAESGEGLSTVSQRLRLLRSEGLVSRRREGKHIYYALGDQHVADLIQSALAHALEPRAHEHDHTAEEES